MNDFADVPVFGLDLVAELHGVNGSSIMARQKVPLENRNASLGSRRQNDVQRYIVGIAVQHPVWKDPEIFSRHVATRLFVATLDRRFVLRSANRARLE